MPDRTDTAAHDPLHIYIARATPARASRSAFPAGSYAARFAFTDWAII